MAAVTSLRTVLPGLLKTVRRFSPQLRRQRTLIAGGGAAMLGEVVFRLLEPWPLKFIIDTIAQPAGTTSAAPDPGATLVLAALGIVAFTGLRAACSYLSTVAFALAGNRVLTEVRANLYSHLQRLSLAFHSRSRSGDLVNRITGDVGRLQEVAVTAALPLAGNLVTFAGMFGVMVWLDWRLTLIALLALPLFLATSISRTRRIRTVSRRQRQQEGDMAAAATESLGAIRVVQAYSLESTLERSFAASNNRSLKDGVKAKRLSAGLERKTDVLVALATGLVLYVGAQRVLSGQLTPGELVVFISYLKNAFKPMRDMAKFTGRLAKAAASGERIVALLDTAPDIRNRSWARPAPAFRGDIHFDDVTVIYRDKDGDKTALAGLDLHVRPGQRVGVIGSSGAGKSTLMSLLLRFQDPTSGRVLIDGHDLLDLTLESVRGQVGIVLQDSVLFATSVRENIAYGAPDVDRVTDEEVEAAARLANAHEFISRLPAGYDTVLGERGATLSGGERQRIAIARAAIRHAPIVVLDEATTGLDDNNRREVQDALRRLTEHRTTFVISHDPAAVVDADIVVQLEQGRVARIGPPSEVLGSAAVIPLPRARPQEGFAGPVRWSRPGATGAEEGR